MNLDTSKFEEISKFVQERVQGIFEIGKKIVLMEKKLSQLPQYCWTMKLQKIKNYWDMEIIGNRRKKSFDKTQNHDLFISPKRRNTALEMSLKSSIMSKLDYQMSKRGTGFSDMDAGI